MPNYKKMYLHLFNETTRAIALLQAAQRTAEQLYTDSDDTPLAPFPPTQSEPDGPPPEP